MINNIVCTDCSNSWDQDGDFDGICRQCGANCMDQVFVSDGDDYDPTKDEEEATKAANDFFDRSRTELADKILQRLSVIFTDYKNVGFENSAQVTKFIMTEIETLIKN